MIHESTAYNFEKLVLQVESISEAKDCLDTQKKALVERAESTVKSTQFSSNTFLLLLFVKML